MWFFVLLAVALVLGLFYIIGHPKMDVENKAFACVFLPVGIGLVGFLIGIPLACATGGMIPDYSNGVREGYITKLSKKGVIWKTWEAEMQIGSGEMSALQSPFAFSIKDDEMAESVRKNLSKKVTLEYRQWLLMPYQIGGSGYEATALTLHPAEKR